MSTDMVQELSDLLASMLDGSVSTRKAVKRAAEITHNYRSWFTSYWRDRRAEIIKESCAQCGTTTPPMVLQHFSHSPSFDTARLQAWEKYRIDHFDGLYKLTHRDVDRPSCPVCGSRVVRHRIRIGNYVCLAQHDKVRCGNVFSDPVMVSVSEPVEYNEERKIVTLYERELKKQFNADSALQREIIERVIRGSIKYLSFDDTATFCRKCAFMWDKKRIKLCPTCHKNWIGIDSTDRCDECSGFARYSICPTCGEHRFDAMRYKQCFACSMKERYAHDGETRE